MNILFVFGEPSARCGTSSLEDQSACVARTFVVRVLIEHSHDHPHHPGVRARGLIYSHLRRGMRGGSGQGRGLALIDAEIDSAWDTDS